MNRCFEAILVLIDKRGLKNEFYVNLLTIEFGVLDIHLICGYLLTKWGIKNLL